MVHFEQTIHILLDPDKKDVQERFQLFIRLLAEPLDYDKQGQLKLNQIMSAYLNGHYYNFCCMAVPFIEECIRSILIKTGFNITKLKAEDGIPTEYKTMSALNFENIGDYIPMEIVMFIRTVLLQGKYYTGLNIRNDVAHGISKWEEYSDYATNLVLYIMFQLARVAIQKKEIDE